MSIVKSRNLWYKYEQSPLALYLKDVAYMPNIEVRALDLTAQVATPIHSSSTSISVQGLNYIWVDVASIATGVEAHLRFKVADRRLILRPDRYTDVVKEVDSEFRRIRSAQQAEVEWRATMTHYPLPGVARMESGAITVGDYLEVEVHELGDQSPLSSHVNLGVVTKIVLALP